MNISPPNGEKSRPILFSAVSSCHFHPPTPPQHSFPCRPYKEVYTGVSHGHRHTPAAKTNPHCYSPRRLPCLLCDALHLLRSSDCPAPHRSGIRGSGHPAGMGPDRVSPPLCNVPVALRQDGGYARQTAVFSHRYRHHGHRPHLRRTGAFIRIFDGRNGHRRIRKCDDICNRPAPSHHQLSPAGTGKNHRDQHGRCLHKPRCRAIFWRHHHRLSRMEGPLSGDRTCYPRRSCRRILCDPKRCKQCTKKTIRLPRHHHLQYLPDTSHRRCLPPAGTLGSRYRPDRRLRSCRILFLGNSCR